MLLISILFCIISMLVFNATANCNNDKCLKALNSNLTQASSFCSVYTTNMAIATPSAINLGCTMSVSKILSACSCINTAATTSKASSTTSPTVKTPSLSHATSPSTILMSLRSSSASAVATMPSTVTVTVTIIQSIAGSQTSSPSILLGPTATTTVYASSTCASAPCSLYELAMAPCVLSFIQEDFGNFQPNCFGIGLGPNYVKSCICPYLSQLPAALSAGPCAAADNANELAYQRSECQCLGATIG